MIFGFNSVSLHQIYGYAQRTTDGAPYGGSGKKI
jgi:hypothetical protein